MSLNKLIIVHLIILSLSIMIGSCSNKTVYIKADTVMVIDKKDSTDKEAENRQTRYQSSWGEDKPVSITSDKMTYRNKEEETVFNGHVIVKQEGLLLKAPYLKVVSKSGLALAMQGVTLLDTEHDATIQSTELQYKQDLSNIKATDNVVFISKDEEGHQIKLMSDELEWQPKEGCGLASGNVVVYYKSTTATAGSMTFSNKQKKIILKIDPEHPTEKPVVLQNEDRITGDQITLVISDKTYIITGNAQAMIDTQAADRKGNK